MQGNSVVQSQKMIVEPGKTGDLLVSQQLTTTGIWIVDATESNETTPIRGYSFEVKTNSEEANVAINEWHDIQRNWYLALADVIIASIALILSVFSIRRRRELSDEEIVALKDRIAKELQPTQAWTGITIRVSDNMVRALEEEREVRKLGSPAETATALLGEYSREEAHAKTRNMNSMNRKRNGKDARAIMYLTEFGCCSFAT